jgi:hypothetical protein
MLTEPISQVVYNTLYFQKLFENDQDFGISSNTPINEYLSRLINLNTKTLLNSNFNNCILSGFDVAVKNIIDSKLYLNIFPGTAILNNYLFELFNLQEDIELEVVDPVNTKYILISLKYNNYEENFTIDFDFLNENLNSLVLGDDFSELLPIKLLKIGLANNQINILSLEDNNITMGGDFDNSIIFNMINYLYLETQFTTDISKDYKPLNKLFDLPRRYIINNNEYLIPNYGKHYEFAFKLMQIFHQNNMMNMIFNYPVMHSHNIYSTIETNMCYI